MTRKLHTGYQYSLSEPQDFREDPANFYKLTVVYLMLQLGNYNLRCQGFAISTAGRFDDLALPECIPNAAPESQFDDPAPFWQEISGQCTLCGGLAKRYKPDQDRRHFPPLYDRLTVRYKPTSPGL